MRSQLRTWVDRVVVAPLLCVLVGGGEVPRHTFLPLHVCPCEHTHSCMAVWGLKVNGGLLSPPHLGECGHPCLGLVGICASRKGPMSIRGHICASLCVKMRVRHHKCASRVCAVVKISAL